MQLIITDAASKWFQQKFNLASGNGVKFYGKTIQPHNVKHGPKQGYKPEPTLDEATIVIKKMVLITILTLRMLGSSQD